MQVTPKQTNIFLHDDDDDDDFNNDDLFNDHDDRNIDDDDDDDQQRKEGGGFGHHITICLIGVKGRSSDWVTLSSLRLIIIIITMLVTSIMTGAWAYFKVPNARLCK